MKVIIVGCGRFGSELAYRLYLAKHEVAVVDHVKDAFNNLPADFNGRLIEGDALNQDVLHRAGIEKADALAAVSNDDSLNIAVAHIANSFYKLKRVVARNYDPQVRPVFERFGIQTVSSSIWGAQRLEELISHPEIRPVLSAGNGEVEVYELFMPSTCAGIKIKELFNIPECIVVAVTRAGNAQFPDGDFILAEDDLVHVSATFSGIEEVRRRLNARAEV
jgi:trk system potassium uptake protein TrkA